MKKLFLMMAMSMVLFVAQAGRTFTHPGALVSNTEIANMKRHIEAKEQPWLSEWNALVSAYGAANYTAAPNTEIGGSGGNRQRACRDAQAAFFNALIWRVRGTEANARCAANILSAWGNKCTSAKEELFQFPCLDMCTAAEFLRGEDGTFYSGWTEANRNKFLNMVRTVFVPALRGQASNGLPSWSAPATAGLMAAGILLDDESIYEEALGYVMNQSSTKSTNIYKGIRDGGQVWEMGRDNVHAMLFVDDVVQMAQMAWNQGDDLYAAGDHRILKCVDYWCRYNGGHTDVPWTVIPSAENSNYKWFYVSMHDNGFRLRPDGTNYECIYHHYKEVLKMDESEYPYLASFTKLARPEYEYGTLIYAESLETSPLFTEKPTQPQNVRAVASKGFNIISWAHPVTEDQRDFYVYRSTDGQTWSQITNIAYNTCNYVYDQNVTEGVTYFYKVRFQNYAGLSEMSEVCSCTAGITEPKLPKGWQVASVSNKIPASATYSATNHHAFQLRGGGREIYYGDDGCGFLYYTFKGDGTITARIMGGDGYQEGLMMRRTLTSGSQMAALKIGGKGGRYCEMWNRVNTNDGKPTMLLGSDYTHLGVWMRLERKGNVFTSYVSRDGVVWNKVANQTIAFGAGDYYAGVFVCNDKNTAGGERYINVDNVTIVNGEQQPTAAPTGLVAKAVNSARINLVWEAVEGADSYTLLRYNPMSQAYDIVVEGIREVAYSDSGLTSSTTYDYALLAENWSGMSTDTAKVSITTPAMSMPLKPQITVAQNGLKSALLRWDAIDEAESFTIRRATEADGTFETIAEAVTDIRYTDTNLTQGTTYYYQVCAVNAVGEVVSETVGTDIVKYVRLGSTITASDNTLTVDYGRNVRGRAHFVEVKVSNGMSYQLKDATLQVASRADFSDTHTVGTIDQLLRNATNTGIPVKVGEDNCRYFRIVTSERSLDKANFTIAVYGDSIKLQAQTIMLPARTFSMALGGEGLDLGATATSGLPCAYASQDESIATVIDGRIHAVGLGRVRITVSQAGDDILWGEAISKTVTVNVKESTGISTVNTDKVPSVQEIYTLDGRKVNATHAPGIYILRLTDGTTRKIKK